MDTLVEHPSKSSLHHGRYAEPLAAFIPQEELIFENFDNAEEYELSQNSYYSCIDILFNTESDAESNPEDLQSFNEEIEECHLLTMTECDTDPIFDVGSISSLEEDSLHDMKQDILQQAILESITDNHKKAKHCEGIKETFIQSEDVSDNTSTSEDSDSEEEDLVNKEAPKQCKFPSKATNEKDYIECFQKYLLDGIYFKSHIMSAILSKKCVKSFSLHITAQKIPVIKITPQKNYIECEDHIVEAVSKKLQEVILKAYNIEYSVADLHQLIVVEPEEKQVLQLEIQHGDSITNIHDNTITQKGQNSRLSALLHAELNIALARESTGRVFRRHVHVPIATLHGLLPTSNERFIQEMLQIGTPVKTHDEMMLDELIVKGKPECRESVGVLLAATANPQKTAEALLRIKDANILRLNGITTSILMDGTNPCSIVGKAGLIGKRSPKAKTYHVVTISKKACEEYLKADTAGDINDVLGDRNDADDYTPQPSQIHPWTMDIGACDFVITVKGCKGENSHHQIKDPKDVKDMCTNLVYLREDQSIHAVANNVYFTENAQVEDKILIFPVIYWPPTQERIPSGSPLMLQNPENGELTFLGGSFTSRSGFHGNFAFQLVKPQIYNKLVYTAINELEGEIEDLKKKVDSCKKIKQCEKLKKEIEEKESQVKLLTNYAKECLKPAICGKKLELKEEYQPNDSPYTISMSLTICMSETKIPHSGSLEENLQGGPENHSPEESSCAIENPSLEESSPNNGSLECSQGAIKNGLKESSPNNGPLEECSHPDN